MVTVEGLRRQLRDGREAVPELEPLRPKEVAEQESPQEGADQDSYGKPIAAEAYRRAEIAVQREKLGRGKKVGREVHLQHLRVPLQGLQAHEDSGAILEQLANQRVFNVK